MDALKASVILPVYNGARTLERCLAALSDQTLPSSDYEIIVVDDGSSDRTAEIAARFPIRLLTQLHRGPAAARNLGVAAAKGEITLFTDADTEPAPDWIEKMLTPFGDPSIAGAKGTYRTRQREWTARFVQIEYEEKYARMARARQIDVIDTYSAAYRREVAFFDGGFDEAFPSASAEDAEFSYRLAKQGYRLVFVPEAIVYHNHAATLRAYVRRKFKIGYWRVRVHTRHPDKIFSDAYTPPTQKLQVLLAPLVIASGVGACLRTQGMWVFVPVMAGFFLSMVPLTRRALRQDAVIGMLAPLFITSRALALSAGAAMGVISQVLWGSELDRPRARPKLERRGP